MGCLREDRGTVAVDMTVVLAHGCSRLVGEKGKRGSSNGVDMGGWEDVGRRKCREKEKEVKFNIEGNKKK